MSNLNNELYFDKQNPFFSTHTLFLTHSPSRKSSGGFEADHSKNTGRAVVTDGS